MNAFNEFLRTLDRAQLIRYVSIYMLVVGIVAFCGGALAFIGGAFAGVGGALGAVALSESQSVDAQEAAQAAGAVVAASGFLLVYGVLNVISGPAMIAVGLGLRARAPWSRMGVVIVVGLHVLVSLIGLFLGGGGILSLVWLVGDAFIVYMFYTDAGVKAEFEKAK